MKTASPLESAIQADIRLALGRDPDLRLFRNNRGVAWMGNVIERVGTTVVLGNARPVEFGLTDGASDLIGLKRVIVAPQMVGNALAVFTAIEVKRSRVAVPDHQQRFVDFVVTFGGIAGVARSPYEAREIIR